MAGGARKRLYGLHVVRGLLDTRPGAIVAAKVLDQRAGAPLEALARSMESLRIPVERVGRRELDRASGGGTHQGVVVEVAAAESFSLGAFEELVVARGGELRLLVLDGVEDPRNLGACLRTADAAGIDAVVVPKSRSVKLTAAASKAAAGAAETVPVLQASNLARTLRWLEDAGVWLVGADAGSGRPLYGTALKPPIALVLGGEGRGLRRLTRELCDELVAIPMQGSVASLNVSVAAGVMLFELVRQQPARECR